MDDALSWQQPFDREAAPKQATSTGATARFGGDGNDEPVLIAVLNGPVESEMARDALAEEHIPVMIKRNSVGIVYGLATGALSRAEVWVLPMFVEQARDVLIGIGLLPEDA